MKFSIIALMLLSVEGIQFNKYAQIDKSQKGIWDKEIDEAMKIVENAKAKAKSGVS